MSRTADALTALLNVSVTPEQACAMRYLEQQGQRFLIDFGYHNAIARARAHWRTRQRPARRRPSHGETVPPC